MRCRAGVIQLEDIPQAHRPARHFRYHCSNSQTVHASLKVEARIAAVAASHLVLLENQWCCAAVGVNGLVDR